MSWVMVCQGMLFDDGTLVGKMLRSFDPENDDGRGGATEWTDDPAQAMQFPSPLAVFELWRTQSVTVPLRPDGKPNRPLTAYTIEPRQLS